MLHRPQSVFLVITIIVLFLVARMPMWSTEAREPNLQSEREHYFDAAPLSAYAHGSPTPIIALLLGFLIKVLNLLAGFIAIYEFFKYKNRVLQIKLGLLNAYVLIVLLGLSWYLFVQRPKETQLLMGCLLPVVALISNLLANHYIRQDEKLVKAAESIR